MKRVTGRIAACTMVAALLLGCGSDGGDGGGGDTSAGGGGTGCPNYSGQWRIDSHCDADATGTVMTITQSGCAVTQMDPWPDWSGTINSDGTMTWSCPTSPGETLTCQATVSGSSLSATCESGCEVAATRL